MRLAPTDSSRQAGHGGQRMYVLRRSYVRKSTKHGICDGKLGTGTHRELMIHLWSVLAAELEPRAARGTKLERPIGRLLAAAGTGSLPAVVILFCIEASPKRENLM